MCRIKDSYVILSYIHINKKFIHLLTNYFRHKLIFVRNKIIFNIAAETEIFYLRKSLVNFKDFYEIVIFLLIIQSASQPEGIWFVLKHLLIIFSISLFLDEGFLFQVNNRNSLRLTWKMFSTTTEFCTIY